MSSPSSEDSLSRWAAAIAAPRASPAGGTAAALSAALAAALVEMVAGMTRTRERYAAVDQRMSDAAARAAALREELLALAVRDAETFAQFERALALPQGSDDERRSRDLAKRGALAEGARVQFRVLERAAELADLAAVVGSDGLATAIGDAATAGFLGAAAARSAWWAVRSNLQDGAQGPGSERWLAEGSKLVQRAEEAEGRIQRALRERLP